MYLRLFNALTDATRALENDNPDHARNVMLVAQQDTEDLFTETEPDILVEPKTIDLRKERNKRRRASLKAKFTGETKE